MANIRDDLRGVVYVHTAQGPTKLRAGDVVPKGAKIDKHFLATAANRRSAPETEEMDNEQSGSSGAAKDN